MSSSAILLIMQGIQAAIAAAPGVIDIVAKSKALIDSLFTAGAITKEAQDALHKECDSLQAMALAGIVPDHWKVEPDPLP